ncbi:MAG: glycosyl hydrolase family 18 protein [Candidatus Roizmanbacteria bacterium]|nr:glycosyl hydrolase family 18 protein [Candidatus Roizmanbacteria bacterium]
MRKLFLLLIGIVVGVGIGYAYFNTSLFSSVEHKIHTVVPVVPDRKQVIGFLPYWLLSKADKEYSNYINTLAYFALTINPDGSIQKYTSPQESEPGYYALQSGKASPFFKDAQRNNMKLSLVVFAGNEEHIGQLVSKPTTHARKLVAEVVPIMKKHGFTDLNIDVESVREASQSAQSNFTRFVSEVKKGIKKSGNTVSIDASPTVFIKPYLVDPKAVGAIVDYFIIMGYDFHFAGSYVTGPVAPLLGAGTISEFDIETSVSLGKQIIPKEKLILALPLYGYEWETIDTFNRAAVMPGSGIAASNRRVEELLKTCENCVVKREEEAQEPYVVYPDEETGTFHQIFYPDKQSMLNKVQFTEKNELGGIALWALGYEGDTILEPLRGYR